MEFSDFCLSCSTLSGFAWNEFFIFRQFKLQCFVAPLLVLPLHLRVVTKQFYSTILDFKFLSSPLSVLMSTDAWSPFCSEVSLCAGSFSCILFFRWRLLSRITTLVKWALENANVVLTVICCATTLLDGLYIMRISLSMLFYWIQLSYKNSLGNIQFFLLNPLFTRELPSQKWNLMTMSYIYQHFWYLNCSSKSILLSAMSTRGIIFKSH